MKHRAILIATLALTVSGVAIAQQRADRAKPLAARAAAAIKTIPYGPDPLQQLDFYPATARNAPLVLFVHGGGWKRGDKSMMRGSDKLEHWRAKGYAVASVNYRLVPKARVEDQAADVASAVALLKRQAAQLGIDTDRIALVGHSAGAHLVALVGTDPQWLRGAGLGLDAIRSVLPLDGAGYDLPSQMGKNEAVLGDTYEQAFGTDPARQRALSPTHHAAAPNAPDFLIMHVERPDAKQQSEGLAAGLRRARTSVAVEAVSGRGLRGHMEINRRLGDPAYPATPIVDAWLARVFAR